jgi:GTP1/Obg family GTP-binding protein
LEHIGSLVLFLLDPSDNATTPLNEQQHLLSEVADLLPQTPLFVVDGKADLLGLEDEENSNPASGHLAISPTTGRGMEELRTELINRIAFPEDAERLSLPEDWPRRDK